MSQAWLRRFLVSSSCGVRADLRSAINRNFSCYGLHTARQPMPSVLRGQANVFARRQPNLAFFSTRSFANRPVQTIYASPLRRAQNFIDRKLPTQWLVYGIVGANGLVYAAWSYAEDCARRFRDFKPLQFMYGNFASSWLNLTRPWTLITSCFSHKDRNHVFVNLLSLIFMGPAAFAVLTTSQAIGLYLIAGLAGNMVQLVPWLFKPSSEGGPFAQRFVLGASGAISGVLSFFAMANPRSTILMFFVVPMPAWAAVAGIVGYDMYLALAHPNGTIAAAAHLGGAAAGVLYFLRLSKMGRIGRSIF